MDLYFSRRRFLETSFYVPSDVTLSDGTRELEEVYSVSTTVRKHSMLPDVTTIEYVGNPDVEKHYVVATIEWRWPSAEKSFILMEGWEAPLRLDEFIVKEKAFRCTRKVIFGEHNFKWRLSPCRGPTLVDANKCPLARLDHHPHGLRPRWKALHVEPGRLQLDTSLLADRELRDNVIASFVAIRASRDMRTICSAWWRKEDADFGDIRVKALL